MHEISKVILTIERFQERKTQNSLSPIEAIRKEICRLADIPASNVFARAKDFGAFLKIEVRKPIVVEFFFIGCSNQQVNHWITYCKQYLTSHSIATSGNTNNSFKLASEPTISNIGLTGFEDNGNEICLNFITPLKIKPTSGKWTGYIDNNQFIQLLVGRVNKIFDTNYECPKDTDGFTVIPYYWNPSSIKHNSNSQKGEVQNISGYIGPLYIKGNFNSIKHLIALAAEVNAGVQNSNSQGYFKVEYNKPFLSKGFPSKQELISSIREASRNHDWLNEEPHFIENSKTPKQYAEKLALLVQKGFKPEPNQAFIVKTSSGKKRLVEKLNPDSLILQHYLHKLIQPYFDRILEDEAVGYRKGISIENAIAQIEHAAKDGYEFVLESDIEDFFPSIDIEKLKIIIDSYIPQADGAVKELLFSFIDTGYILDGKEYTREKGLAQGAILSPILANLYLDGFDELVKNEDVRLIRFADDFVIMTKTRQKAEEIKVLVSDALSKISLKLKPEKTTIYHLSQGFTFLGIHFSSEGAKRVLESDYRLQKKPLYVSQPYTYLKLNGEAISIVKEGKVIDTFPLRRIGSIVITENTTLTSILIQKCAQLNIPITLTNQGYYVNTIKPDSKNYFAISANHFNTYNQLDVSEALLFAKEIARCKLLNFQTLFRQRYSKQDKHFHNTLNNFINKIDSADSVEQIRGYEGAATKEIFKKLNTLINNKAFTLKTRSRFATDPMNSLLNFGFYLLFTTINAEVRVNGLNPYLGYLHSPSDRYESLTADIEELFRCFIVRMIIRLVNLGVIKEDDFEINKKKRLYLTPNARKKFYSEFERMMLQKVGRHSIRECIHNQIVYFRIWAEDKAMPIFFKWN